ncbi:MAG TPA: NAD+ synthase [Chthoniobacterales bacterium]|jgi:NAD+ synthetase
MRIGLAQLNVTVGDFAGNTALILEAYRSLVADEAELVITPELVIPGYPPQDLIFRSQFVPLNLEALHQLAKSIGEIPLLVGYLDFNEDLSGRSFRNAAALLRKGKIVERFYKTLLPTYDVFDESRYFEPSTALNIFTLGNTKVGVTICEDIWTEEYLSRNLYSQDPVEKLIAAGADIIVNLSSSPFNIGKPAIRLQMVRALAAQHGIPFYYCNAVGGNDQLIFDGNSLAINSRGEILALLASFEEDRAVVSTGASILHPLMQEESEELYQALRLGVRDYFRKTGFHKAILGLSGGIDSAVVAAIAADALGPEKVTGVAMPSEFSSPGSLDDAHALAKNLGIEYLTLPIQASLESVQAQLRAVFDSEPDGATEENLQSRLRGLTLMALSNKHGHLVLSTGNKSELAVGYCTLYGDMCGGLAVISDVPKMKVYSLARWINRDREIIPATTLTKAPSAELRLNQTDQDTLPSYELLDEILSLYVESKLGVRDIVARGFDEKIVRSVLRKIDLNEYKRAQAAPGLKVTSTAFGMGRRMPIAQRFTE